MCQPETLTDTHGYTTCLSTWQNTRVPELSQLQPAALSGITQPSGSTVARVERVWSVRWLPHRLSHKGDSMSLETTDDTLLEEEDQTFHLLKMKMMLPFRDSFPQSAGHSR